MAAINYDWDPVFDCVAEEFDDAATTSKFTHEPSLFGGVISQNQSIGTRIYHFDAIGTTRALTDDSQIITDAAVYGAFGEKTASIGNTVTPFGFVGSLGYQSSSFIPLVYVRSRHFQPTHLRWMSKDPLSMMSEYKYCSNSPRDSFKTVSGRLR